MKTTRTRSQLHQYLKATRKLLPLTQAEKLQKAMILFRSRTHKKEARAAESLRLRTVEQQIRVVKA